MHEFYHEKFFKMKINWILNYCQLNQWHAHTNANDTACEENYNRCFIHLREIIGKSAKKNGMHEI